MCERDKFLGYNDTFTLSIKCLKSHRRRQIPLQLWRRISYEGAKTVSTRLIRMGYSLHSLLPLILVYSNIDCKVTSLARR